MSYFIHNEPLALNEPFALSGPEAEHAVRVRRIRNGEHIAIQDSDKQRFLCRVTSQSKQSLSAVPQSVIPTPLEPVCQLTVFQALINEQALDIIVQKATELGVHEVSVFIAERSPLHLNAEAISKKISRWQKIAVEAAKQSDRLIPAHISYVGRCAEALSSSAANGPAWYAEAVAEQPLTAALLSAKTDIKNASVFIGPEGGWSESEIDRLHHAAHATAGSLGPRTLRAETAAIAAVTLFQSRFGDI